MPLSFTHLLLCVWLIYGSFYAGAQQSVKRSFQLSFVPALGTNGIHPGNFSNAVSINLTSGYSQSSLGFEVSGLSSLNTNFTRGIQISGISNMTGANFLGGLSLKQQQEKLKSGFTAALYGMQLSGLLNFAHDGVFGSQFSGGFNVTRGPLLGVQLSGLFNVVYKYSFGVQVSGLANVSYQSMDGVQLALLTNYTSGGLYGLQVGAFNEAYFTEGRNSVDDAGHWGFQLGLVNKAQRMNGFQIGLINWTKQSQGTQIGLINIYRPSRQAGTRDGTAIGLLNFGDFGFLSVSSTDMFSIQYELATGNRKNARIQLATKNVYVTNVLSYSPSSHLGETWAYGYGVQKMFFNRSALPGMTEFRFMAVGMHVHQLNPNKGDLNKDLDLLTQAKIVGGTRLSSKLYNLYLFASLSANFIGSGQYDTSLPLKLTRQIENGRIWPGLSAGVLIH